jgi:hypothetical protein
MGVHRTPGHPTTGLNNIINATINASPIANTTYTVSVANSYGCINTDSVKNNSSPPFQLNLQSEATVCKGSSIELNLRELLPINGLEIRTL